MIPPAFEYLRPKTIPEAIAFLEQYGDDAKILSGGQSLIPMMKFRLARPGHLIDINRIPGLAYVRKDYGTLVIGALAREADLEESELVQTHYPILIDTTRMIADPLVRNLATVCGNLAHADPANDHPSTMLALGAEVVAAGPHGGRRILIAEFFTGPFTTALQPDEMVTEIRVPLPPPRSGGAYVKLERKVGDFATAAVAAQVTLAANGTCERVGIGLTNVGLAPIEAGIPALIKPLTCWVRWRQRANNGGGPTSALGTPELYFTDPDNIRIQLQDVSYCGGSGRLGQICP